MKLTNYLREAFVNAAMNDVPEVDYNEMWHKLVLPAYLETLPKEIQAVWNNPNLRPYLETGSMDSPGYNLTVPCANDYQVRSNLTPPANVKAEADKLRVAYKVQRAERQKLRSMLEGVAKSATTRKALATALPEFEKYLPAEEQPMSRTVPVLANVVSEFAKAGWPKAKKAA